jgi:hypothetical protein
LVQLAAKKILMDSVEFKQLIDDLQ